MTKFRSAVSLCLIHSLWLWSLAFTILSIRKQCDFCQKRKQRCDLPENALGPCRGCVSRQMPCVILPRVSRSSDISFALLPSPTGLHPKRCSLTPLLQQTERDAISAAPNPAHQIPFQPQDQPLGSRPTTCFAAGSSTLVPQPFLSPSPHAPYHNYGSQATP